MGDPVSLTFSFSNLFNGALLDSNEDPVPQEQMYGAIIEALEVWAEVAPLHFTEVEDQGGGAPDSNYPLGQFERFVLVPIKLMASVAPKRMLFSHRLIMSLALFALMSILIQPTAGNWLARLNTPTF